MAPTSVLAEFAKTHKNVATNRGFTGHEMLDEVGIIHMNGRIYDASIGRFLQADPHIDGAGSVGGYNRYSYLKNNPLNGTDPTGYFSLKKELKNGWNKVRPLVGAIVGIALAVWMPWDGGFGAMVAYGAIAGGAGAAANGGNVSDVIRGAAIGGASAAAFFGVAKAIPSAASAAEAGKNAFRIGKNAWMTAGNFAKLVVAQGMVGGVMSVLQSGKFGHGFASAGISKLATPGILSMDNVIAESIASGMVGGTVSEATGGKFANGATTAAFLYAFNAGSTAIKDAQEGGGRFTPAPEHQGVIDTATDLVYQDYPSLKALGVTVVAADIKETWWSRLRGKVQLGHADISSKTVFVKNRGDLSLNAANIFHEILHVHEAVAFYGSGATNFDYHFRFNQGHDTIRSFEGRYEGFLRNREFGYPGSKPNLSDLPW